MIIIWIKFQSKTICMQFSVIILYIKGKQTTANRVSGLHMIENQYPREV